MIGSTFAHRGVPTAAPPSGDRDPGCVGSTMFAFSAFTLINAAGTLRTASNETSESRRLPGPRWEGRDER
jgi:hypothetical protein